MNYITNEKILSNILKLYNRVTNNTININTLENLIKDKKENKEIIKEKYLNCLLYPELSKGCKIPSTIPVPSCSFQIHNTITLNTNDKGNLCFLFNPFFLYDSNLHNTTYDGKPIEFATSLLVNKNDSLTGTEPNPNFFPNNIGQGIPNIYNQYRIVSAAIVVRYIGCMDITSGVIGGAIIFDDDIYPSYKTSEVVSMTRNIAKYGNFDLAMDSYYHQETNCVNGIRLVYFPIDNTYEEYQKFYANLSGNNNTFKGLTKNGFQQMVYVLGAPPSTACFKVDIYCNFEGLPNATALNYLPIGNNSSILSNEDKAIIYQNIQTKSITDANRLQLKIMK